MSLMGQQSILHQIVTLGFDKMFVDWSHDCLLERLKIRENLIDLERLSTKISEILNSKKLLTVLDIHKVGY